VDKKSSTVNKQEPDKNGSSLNNGPKHTDLALKPKTERPPAIKFFPGEDPFYGGRSLYVDLPPFTAKYSSLRNLVTPESWKKIVNLVLSRAEKKCELCGLFESKCTPKKLEVHSRWHFSLSKNPLTTKTGIQTLKRLIALCPKCYQVTNFDMVKDSSKENEAVLYLAERNKWPRHMALKHIKEAFVTRDFMSRVPGFNIDMHVFDGCEWFVPKNSGDKI